jgi:hypothetical protein
MMKYLCLVFIDEKKLEGLPKNESQALTDESHDYDDTLRGGGHFLAAQALEPVRASSTVRVQNGKTSILDGPFAETKEQIGGFILIDAKDMAEARQLAAGIPNARLGGIEIRPIKELTRSLPKKRSRAELD